MGEIKMSTVIRPEISEKNKYYIDKHRYYELKHFCLQYKEWKKAYELCNDSIIFTASLDTNSFGTNTPSDLTAKYAIRQAEYATRIKMVEHIAKEADDFLYPYILKAVTEGLSYPYLKTKMNIPCGRDMYYDRYRKFFWLLSQERN
jgi:hypothetical protein